MAFDKNRVGRIPGQPPGADLFQALAREIGPLGLAPGQFMVLLELWREEGLTQRDLVDRLDVEQATLANTLARMERDGLVRRKPHPVDGRAQSIHLTDRARRLEAPATKAADGINRRMLADLTAESAGASSTRCGA